MTEAVELTVKVQEYFFWSPLLGEDAVRFSVFDSHGKEFFAIVPLISPGMRLRESRQQWAELIHDAMIAGNEPGEVTTNGGK